MPDKYEKKNFVSCKINLIQNDDGLIFFTKINKRNQRDNNEIDKDDILKFLSTTTTIVQSNHTKLLINTGQSGAKRSKDSSRKSS